MAAGVTDKLWDVVDLVRVIEEWEAQQVAKLATPYSQPAAPST
jgi:hypothetical protein